jgi:hypothetical protein
MRVKLLSPHGLLDVENESVELLDLPEQLFYLFFVWLNATLAVKIYFVLYLASQCKLPPAYGFQNLHRPQRDAEFALEFLKPQFLASALDEWFAIVEFLQGLGQFLPRNSHTSIDFAKQRDHSSGREIKSA